MSVLVTESTLGQSVHMHQVLIEEYKENSIQFDQALKSHYPAKTELLLWEFVVLQGSFCMDAVSSKMSTS